MNLTELAVKTVYWFFLYGLSLIHISEPTRLTDIWYDVFWL